MSKRNDAVGKETVDLKVAEPADAGDGAQKVRVVEPAAVISTAFKAFEELMAFAVLPRESMASTMFFHR